MRPLAKQWRVAAGSAAVVDEFARPGARPHDVLADLSFVLRGGPRRCVHCAIGVARRSSPDGRALCAMRRFGVPVSACDGSRASGEAMVVRADERRHGSHTLHSVSLSSWHSRVVAEA